MNIEKVARKVVKLAQKANALGTFGVGGVLVNDAGRIYHEALNRVVFDGVVNDPTAHVERQIVDWYYRNLKRKKLPPPGKLTIISSLDPCMMCAGAILTAGLNVVSLCFDERAGVNYAKDFKFGTLPPILAEKAKRTFGYFCEPDKGSEESRLIGGFPAYLKGSCLCNKHRKEAAKAFTQRPGKVTQRIADDQDRIEPDSFFDDLHTLSETRKRSPYFYYPFAKPGDAERILRGLARRAERLGARGNAAAILDSSGRLLAACHGQEYLSPIRTAYLELSRLYASLRRWTHQKHGAHVLPHPKFCQTILLNEPGFESTDILDLGAYGSTMEETIPPHNPRHLQFIAPHSKPPGVVRIVKKFPPRYTKDIGIVPMRAQFS